MYFIILIIILPKTNAELKKAKNPETTSICYIYEKYNDIGDIIIKNVGYKINIVLGGESKNNKFYSNMGQWLKF